jgi:uncharacterized Tic20 family protein
MNNQISLRFRLLAAGLQLILPGSIGSFFGFLAVQLIVIRSYVNPSFDLLFLYNLIFGLLLILIAPVIIWICWLILRRIHPIINLAGQDAINCALNNMVVILTLAFIFGTTCGAINMAQSLDPNTSNIILDSSIMLFDLVAIFYAVSSAIASIFTLNGNRFNHRFIYPFIRDE